MIELYMYCRSSASCACISVFICENELVTPSFFVLERNLVLFSMIVLSMVQHAQMVVGSMNH
jgi:hypothetical protein